MNSSNIEKRWLLVDASNISLGRLATQVAYLIRGKNKPYFTPHVDCGDNVIVKNAEKIIAKGIDKIFCISVNDPHVMNAWGEANNVRNNIKMLADPYLSFTKLIGAEIDRNSKGMGIRSSRYAMIIENLKVQNIQEEEETKSCGISSAEGILDII